MIVKAEDARAESFRGTTFEVLAIGENSMVTKMHFKQGKDVPRHSHDSEQSGYVVSGRYRLQFGEYDELLEAGDSYSIPGGVEHSYEILESGVVIDVFAPPREDYL
ncbi:MULTISPECIES: cupin domain-containing protein [unclassified Haladaptatus]|uniref:cupin domain-containing protein n=1 Tax=unclassified Haladaptatus TaxID=2622732 RepID=UPI0023E8C22C|nr:MULTISPECIES: cupin domain-containing protein [unclassified Haladaptatus]